MATKRSLKRAVKSADTPEALSAYAEGMLPRYSTINACLGGTRAMRAAGEDLLPRYPSESDKSYKSRLARSTFFNLFGETVGHLVGQVFAKPISFTDAPAEGSEEAAWLDDFNRQGQDINTVARRFFRGAVAKADCYLLVDFPKKDASIRTAADQLQSGQRPYGVLIQAEDVLTYQPRRIRGREFCTRFRFKRTAISRDGEFNEEIIEEIVDYIAAVPASAEDGEEAITGSVIIYRREGNAGSQGEWKKHDEAPFTFKYAGESVIPVVALSLSEKDEDGLRRPPLEDLADKNVEHWQSSSDQRNILTMARFPMLAGSGVKRDDLPKNDEGEVILSSETILTSAEAAGKWYWIEPAGNAIQAGERDLKRLVEEMAHLAMQPLMAMPGGETATRSALSEGKAASSLESWAALLKDALTLALSYFGAWMNRPDWDPGIEINVKVGLDQIDPEKVKFLKEARAAGDITREEYLKEAIALGLLSDAFDVKANAAGLQVESGLSLEDDQPPPDDENEEA